MALGFYFAPTAMTARKYDECIKELTKAGALHPAGRTYHVSFGSPDRLQVFDVWESQESFNRFGATLMPILQALGVDPGTPDVMSVHNRIVPPAAGAKATRGKAAKKSKPAKRPARKAKKAAKRRR